MGLVLFVGLVLTVLARVFVFISPRLIGAAALLGTVASIFAALAWLSLSFQTLLIGAAWMAERDAPRVAAAPTSATSSAVPTPPTPPTPSSDPAVTTSPEVPTPTTQGDPRRED